MASPQPVDPLAHTATNEPIDPRADTLPSESDPSALPASHARRSLGMIGRVLGYFRVDALLGEGGMGAVYRAWDTSLLRPVALKVVLADSPASRARFLREARAQAQLRHPNVVPIHYVGEADGVVFLVMDLVEGESLADLLRREPKIDADRALAIADSVAGALEAGAAAGLIHRDVKPSNILLERGGRTLLADFGLAKEVTGASDPQGMIAELPPVEIELSPSSPALTREGAIVGTPAYLAPEQAGGGPVDHRADMYALGVTLYEALTGKVPFAGSTPTAILEKHKLEEAPAPRSVDADIHPAAERLVVRMMAKRPDARFATWAELRAAIAAARVPPPVLAPIFPRAVAFVIDLMLLAIVAGAVGALIHVPLFGWIFGALGVAAAEHAWGNTPGKRLMNLRVIDRFDAPPSFSAAVTRSLVKHAGILVGSAVELARVPTLAQQIASALLFVATLIGYAVVFGKARSALHDRAAHTRVVYALAAERRLP